MIFRLGVVLRREAQGPDGTVGCNKRSLNTVSNTIKATIEWSFMQILSSNEVSRCFPWQRTVIYGCRGK